MSFYVFYIANYQHSTNYQETKPYVDPHPAGPFFLEIKEKIEQYQEKALEHLKKLKEAIGIEYTFLVDFEKLHKLLPHSIFKKIMVELALDKYLRALVDNIVEFVNKSPEYKKSFIFKTLKKSIVFDPFFSNAKKPMELEFREDSLYIKLQPSEFDFLPEKTSENLQSLL